MKSRPISKPLLSRSRSEIDPSTQPRVYLDEHQISRLPEFWKESSANMTVLADLETIAASDMDASVRNKRQPSKSNMSLSDDKHFGAANLVSWMLNLVLVYAVEIPVLTWRCFWVYVRNPFKTAHFFGEKFVAGSILGWFFWQLGAADETAVRNRTALLFFLILVLTIALHAALATFPHRKALVNKEVANGMYRAESYYIAQNLADLPYVHAGETITCSIIFWMAGLRADGNRFWMFLLIMHLCVFCIIGFMMAVSAGCDNAEVANIQFSMMVLCFILVTGFFVNSTNIPQPAQWVEWLSYFRFSFNALMLNEMHGLEFEAYPFKGDYVLYEFGITTWVSSFWFTLPYLVMLGLLYRAVGMVLFVFTNRKVGLEL